MIVIATPGSALAQGAGDGVFKDPQKVFGPVMGFIMSLFSWLLAMAGLLLDQAVQYTVVGMGTWVRGLGAIGVTWTVLRDLGNIVLIFGFLAVGITTILNVNWYGGGTKMIPTLLIVAIFLNFSLFIAQAIIDVGNLIATQIYAQINGGTLSSSGTLGTVWGEGGISSLVMSHIGLQTVYGVSGGVATGGWDTMTIFAGLLGILLFIIAAFVFFSLAFMLISRFVILIFLMIVSPLGFAGLAVPKLEGYAKQWWSMLLQQTFTAPVLLLTLYVALKVITDTSYLRAFGVADAAAAQTAMQNLVTMQSASSLQGAMGVLLSFVVSMGLLMACVIIAKKMSAFGASWATKTGGALSFGAAGFFGRQTVGRLSYTMQKRFNTSKYARSGAGRLVSSALGVGAKASFDVRGAKAFSSNYKEAGDANKGGYEKIAKEAVKARVEYGKTLGLSKSEQGRVKTAEGDVKTLKARKESELSDLETSHRAARVPYADDIEKKRRTAEATRGRLDAAKAAGNDHEVSREEAQLKTDQMALSNSLEIQRNLIQDQQQERKKLETDLDQLVGAQEQLVKDMKGAPLNKYVGNLESSGIFGRFWPNYDATAVNREAAKALAKDRDKSDAARLADTISGALDKVASSAGGAKKEDSGH